MRRDSGPAIAAGAAFAVARDNEAVVLALAADHVVRDTAAFIAACRQGLAAAESGRIVTFGVKRAPGDRIRLHQSGRGGLGRGAHDCKIR
jgi:mannose-1-phosphate guanylyltransferase